MCNLLDRSDLVSDVYCPSTVIILTEIMLLLPESHYNTYFSVQQDCLTLMEMCSIRSYSDHCPAAVKMNEFFLSNSNISQLDTQVELSPAFCGRF